MIECQVNFVMNVIKEMMKRNATIVDITLNAQNNCMEAIREEMKNTVWGTNKCASWYENNKGEITALWPESCTSYWNKLRNVDFSLFNFQ